jgi:putative phosphoesterase
MRLAVISDVHGNLTALEAVVADLKRVAPDQVIFGGDLVANGPRPADVIDLIRDRGWPSVLGNTDEMLWRPELLQQLLDGSPRGPLLEVLFRHISPFVVDLVGKDRLEWLKQLQPTWSNGLLSVVHAGPGDLWRAPRPDASDTELVTAYSSLATPVVVYGHIHRPFVRALEGLTVANSGSVSLSYDGDPRAAYAVVEDGRVTIRRVDYDPAEEVRLLRERTYPYAEWLSSILVTGSYSPPITAPRS